MDFQGSWEEHLSLVEFVYNNSYHSTIGMNPMRHCMGGLVGNRFVGLSQRIVYC